MLLIQVIKSSYRRSHETEKMEGEEIALLDPGIEPPSGTMDRLKNGKFAVSW